jgi:hypothetical protein
MHSNSLGEEHNDKETNGVVRWYADVEQKKICEGHVVCESPKNDYFSGEVLHNLNPTCHLQRLLIQS